MGKKKGDKKKGKGAEKTATKTDKKLLLKQKKMLEKIGEADIENLIKKCEDEQKRQLETVEIVVPPPTSRVNFSICNHPEKEEIIIFGGEFFNGQKTEVFNDLYFYNINKNEWKQLKSPAGPTSRSGHQMVSVAADGGKLWLFGGEYASPSQIQFYHFRDLWVFHLKGKQWEKINSPNGPSARSGHRMVVAKKQLIVFGGFHDNNQTYHYYNDVHLFSMETYTWTKIEPTGSIPPPRSGCCMAAATQDNKILIWGGYSKSAVKKKCDRGITHSDMYQLMQDKNDATGLKWKWSLVKPGGMRPHPRSGMGYATAPNGKCYVFGGVMDTEEDEEDLRGQFGNDLHILELSNPVWRLVELTSRREKISKKKTKEEMDVEMEETKGDVKVSSDGIFTMVVGGSKGGESSTTNAKRDSVNMPSPRMNSGLIICKGVLYLFGGIVEEGSKQFTLCDFYSLDLHKLTEWKTIIPNTITAKDWLGSDSEDSGNSEDDDDSENDEDDSDEDDSDDDSDEMDTD